jgi:hypothetical protein
MRAATLRRIVREEIAEIRHDVHENNGGSLKDALARIDSGIAHLRARATTINLHLPKDDAEIDDTLGQRADFGIQEVDPPRDRLIARLPDGGRDFQIGAQLLQGGSGLELIHNSSLPVDADTSTVEGNPGGDSGQPPSQTTNERPPGI